MFGGYLHLHWRCVHPVQGRLVQLEGGQRVMAHVPSHHDHQVGEWIGIRAQVDHVVTLPRLAAVVAK